MVGVFHLPPGGHPASWRTGGIFPGGFSLLFRPQAAHQSPQGTPREAPTETPRLLSTASVTKGNVPTRHGHAQASEQGGGDTKITVFPTWHRGCAVSPPCPPLPSGLAPLPPLSPSRSRGAAGAEGAKWDFFMGLGEHWKLDITRATMKPPPKYPPTPGTHTHARTHQDTGDHTRGNIAPAGTPWGKTPSRPLSGPKASGSLLPSPMPPMSPSPTSSKQGTEAQLRPAPPLRAAQCPKCWGEEGGWQGILSPCPFSLLVLRSLLHPK